MRPLLSVCVIVCTVAAGLAVSSCCCPSEEDLAKIKEQQEKDKKVYKKWAKALGAMYKDFPDPGKLKKKSCPDKTIKKFVDKQKGYDKGRIPTADLEFFEQFAKPDSKGAKEAADYKYEWAWQRTGELQGIKSPDYVESYWSDQIRRMKKIKEGRYVGVYVANRRGMPIVEKDPFIFGHYDGWLVIIDTDDDRMKPVCQAPLTAKSSSKVDFNVRFGNEKRSGDNAIIDDFKDNFRESAEASLERMTEHLKL